MTVSKKQIEAWIEELNIDWNSHGITKKQLIDEAHKDPDPRNYLEELASAETEEEEDDGQVDEADEILPEHVDDVPSDEPSDEEPGDQPQPAYARQGTAHRPVCPIHKQLMRAASTQGPLTYYQCQVAGCSHSESVPRVNMQQFMQRQAERDLRRPNVDPRN